MLHCRDIHVPNIQPTSVGAAPTTYSTNVELESPYLRKHLLASNKNRVKMCLAYDYSQTIEDIDMKFGTHIILGTEKKPIVFGGDDVDNDVTGKRCNLRQIRKNV